MYFRAVSTEVCFVGSLISRPSGSKVFVSGEESHHSEIRHFLNGYNTAVLGNLGLDFFTLLSGRWRVSVSVVSEVPETRTLPVSKRETSRVTASLLVRVQV